MKFSHFQREQNFLSLDGLIFPLLRGRCPIYSTIHRKQTQANGKEASCMSLLSVNTIQFDQVQAIKSVVSKKARNSVFRYTISIGICVGR